MTITFVTSNDIKFHSAERIGRELGFTLERANVDFDEIQASSESIARHKATQAYAALQKPVVITDDAWLVPGLNGFPGAYMKQINEWFTADDWLRLTRDLTDRRIILQQHIVYQDEHGQQHFTEDVIGTLLTESRGESIHNNLTILSFDDDGRSRAEHLAEGTPLLGVDRQTAWHHLAKWLTSRDA